jgi:energy-converting hydrogenase Eha subunit E
MENVDAPPLYGVTFTLVFLGFRSLLFLLAFMEITSSLARLALLPFSGKKVWY